MPISESFFDEFYDDIDKMGVRLFANIQKMGTAIEGFSETQLVRLARELDFFNELQEMGFNTSFEKLMQGYDAEAEGILKDMQKVVRARTAGTGAEIFLSTANTERIANQLEILRDLDGEVMLGQFKVETAKLKTELMRGIIAGEPAGVVGQRLSAEWSNADGVPTLIGERARMIARDSFGQFSQTSTFNVFKQSPNQLFRYLGSRDKKNRPSCRYFLDNQKNKKGWTRKEIEGIAKSMGNAKLPLPVYSNKKKTFVAKYQKAEFSLTKLGGPNCRHNFRPMGSRKPKD
jgi:hypothetical protein